MPPTAVSMAMKTLPKTTRAVVTIVFSLLFGVSGRDADAQPDLSYSV